MGQNQRKKNNMLLIILTYIGGVLTILSPCILPVLPFVFARGSSESFAKTSLPILIGMSLTFSLFSAIAILGGEWVAQANEYGRGIAMVFLSLFGLSLLFPHLAEKMLTPITRLGSKIASSSKPDQNSSILGSLLIGVSTGLLWAPCAGPILGLVLTGAATRGSTGKSIALLFSYSLGAASSLALALLAGKSFFNRLKKILGVDQVIKKVLGATVLLGVVAIAFNLDRTLLVRLSKVETGALENRLLALVDSPKLLLEGEMPELLGLTTWLNSSPLNRKALLGKVVLIDFWTYSCINCLRTLPHLKEWAEKYKDDQFVVIGIHAPEFAFEKSEANVKNAVKDLGITYPVALDNDYKVWKAFQNHYWPAHYFIDRQGQIRHHHFGEGEYAQSEAIIRELLTENGGKIRSVNADASDGTIKSTQAPGVMNNEISPETYIGTARAKNRVTSPPVEEDEVVKYTRARTLTKNEWSLDGQWLVSKEKATLKGAAGKISFRFHARDLHLVLGSVKNISFQVKIDGKSPGASHGMDTDSQGKGIVTEHRLYNLIRQNETEQVTDHTFEIEFSEPGVEAYAFTFG